MDYFSHHIGNVIIPTDFHSIIFQRGRAKNHQPDKDSWDPWIAFPRKLTEGLRPCPETTDDISLPSGGEIQGANWKIIILNR